MKTFEGDEAGFHHWLYSNMSGYVVNTPRSG
jgi:hypothetical protein